MKSANTTIDAQEVDKFAQHALEWWDKEGPLKTLHDINPTRLNFISDHCNLTDSKVLDVGCGGGILCEAMAKMGAQVSGIDVQDGAIKIAKSHAQSEQLTMDYQCMPIEEFASTSFDIITCMELLEHVASPALVLEHCKRLLKPGGLLFLSTINRTLKAYTHAILAAEYLLNIVPKQTHDYQKFIKPSELIALCRALDLSVLDLKGMAYNPFTRRANLQEDVAINYLMVLRSGD